MYHIKVNINQGVPGAQLILHGDEGGREGIVISFPGSTTLDTIERAQIDWFDGKVIDLDVLKTKVPDVVRMGWATGRRQVWPDYKNHKLVFAVSPLG